MEEHVRDTIAGGTWLFLGNLTLSLSGLVFWLVIASIVGASSIGIASIVVSSSAIAVTLVSAGLNIAVIREVAARGVRASIASLLLALIAGSIAAAISIPLVCGVGYGELSIYSSLLALSTTMSIACMFSLIGLERFREYFVAIAAGSVAKLFIGIVLAVIGMRMLAPILGYLAYPVVASATALCFLAPSIARAAKTGSAPFSSGDLKSVALLALSNYPYVFSNQLLSMLSVYVFAYLVGKPVSTGVLYISLMVALAIAALPNSLLSAALPIGTRRGVDPFSESLRIGLALATPIAVAVIAAPRAVLSLINPELVGGADTLRVLLLSIAPLTALTAAITRLNKEGERRVLAIVGVARLVLLIALLAPLTRAYGALGAATAFLAANTLTLPIALRYLPNALRAIATPWTLHTATMLISYLAPLNELIVAAIAVVASIAVLHLTRTITIDELYNTLRTATSTLYKHRH